MSYRKTNFKGPTLKVLTVYIGAIYLGILIWAYPQNWGKPRETWVGHLCNYAGYMIAATLVIGLILWVSFLIIAAIYGALKVIPIPAKPEEPEDLYKEHTTLTEKEIKEEISASVKTGLSIDIKEVYLADENGVKEFKIVLPKEASTEFAQKLYEGFKNNAREKYPDKDRVYIGYRASEKVLEYYDMIPKIKG